MREWILTFLEEKQNLSSNSKQSYKYDLEQFLDLIGCLLYTSPSPRDS